MSYQKKCIRVFFTSLFISAAAFGGGFVVLGMLRRWFVDKYEWLSNDEMTNSIAIAQSAPGTIAGNAMMLVGYQTAGVLGAFLVMIACILPPLFIISVLTLVYNSIREYAIVDNLMRGMSAGVGAVIISLVIDMVRDASGNGKNKLAVVLIGIAFAASYILKVGAIYIIIAAAVVGIASSYIRFYLLRNRHEGDGV